MVFGVFDIFHPGHEYFLSEAESRCNELIVVVTVSEVVSLLKKLPPKNPYELRASSVKKYNSKYIVIPGDSTVGGWKVLKDNQFDIILLGYDQQSIARELDRLGVPYEFLDSHMPEVYKSSLLRGK